jgi:hypothetical protein
VERGQEGIPRMPRESRGGGVCATGFPGESDLSRRRCTLELFIPPCVRGPTEETRLAHGLPLAEAVKTTGAGAESWFVDSSAV